MCARYIGRRRVKRDPNSGIGRNVVINIANGGELSTRGLRSASNAAESGKGFYKGVPIIQRTGVTNASAKLSRLPMRMEKRVIAQSILAAYRKAEVEEFKYKTFLDFYKEVLIHFGKRQSHIKNGFIPNKSSVSRTVLELSQMGLVK